MKIEIRHMEMVTEGTLIYAVIPELERPLAPHYITGDTEKEKEIELLHLGEAELTQKEDKK
jgi:hypothetical protein